MLRFLTKKVSNANYTKKAKTQAAVRPDETDLQSKLSVLKTMVVSNDNIDMIKSVLIDTAWRRSQMVKEAKLDFLEHFPVFYVHPELVRAAIMIVNFGNFGHFLSLFSQIKGFVRFCQPL